MGNISKTAAPAGDRGKELAATQSTNNGLCDVTREREKKKKKKGEEEEEEGEKGGRRKGEK